MAPNLALKLNAVHIVAFDGAGAIRTAMAGGQVEFNIGQAEGAEVIRVNLEGLTGYKAHQAEHTISAWGSARP